MIPKNDLFHITAFIHPKDTACIIHKHIVPQYSQIYRKIISQLPNAYARSSLFLSTNANSLSVKCSRPKRGIINVHSSGKLFIQAILNKGKYPILGLSYLGVFGLAWSHVVCAGIYKRSTIQRNNAAAKLKPVQQTNFLSPKSDTCAQQSTAMTIKAFRGGKYLKYCMHYLRKVRVRMKTTAANQLTATYPKISSCRPNSVCVMNKCLSIQIILAQQTRQRKRKQQRIALQTSTVEALIAGVGEVSLKMACIPIHGKSLKMSLSPSARMNRQQRKARSMTAGAATIVPYMQSDVTMETTVKDRSTFPKSMTFSQADTLLP